MFINISKPFKKQVFHNTIVRLLQIVCVIAARGIMFMIYLRWEQNQRTFSTYIDNNYTYVKKCQGNPDFKTTQTKNVKHRKTKI